MQLKSLSSITGGFICFVLLLVCTVSGDEKFDELFANKEYKKAIEYADSSIPAASRTVDIWVKLGEANEKTGSANEKILVCYKNAQTANPSDPRVYIGLGKCAMNENKNADALKHYQRAYILKRTAEAAEGIAIAASKLENWDKARDAAESAISLDKEVLESRLILCDIYKKENNYRAAAEQLEVIVGKNPSMLKYWKRLALCYEKINDAEKLKTVDPNIIKLDKSDIKSRQRHAEYSLKNNDISTAFALYKELAILTPNDPVVFKNLYQISKDKNQKDDAILYVKNFIALDSSDANYFKELGNLLFEKDDYDGALEAFRKTLKTDQKIKGYFKRYEKIVLKKELTEEAVKVINLGIAAQEADAESYIALGNIYKAKGQFAEALKMYEEALKTDTKNIKVLTSLGECQAKINKTNEAILTYEQVLLLNSNAVEEYKILGELQEKLNKSDKAVDTYKKYLKKVPSDAKTAKTVGLYEYGKKEYRGAIEYLEMVKDAKYHDVEYLVALGHSYLNIKNYANAVDSYAKAKAKKLPVPVLQDILKPMGECYEKIGDKTKASEAYEEYTKISGVKDADASYMQAFLREEANKETALRIYEANTVLFPNDHRNFLRLGMLYSQDKANLSKSAAMLSKASQIITDDPVIWRTLAEVYGKLGNEEKELAAYKKYLTIEPQNLAANRRAGTLLLSKKMYPEALVNLEMVLTLSPKDFEIMCMLADGYVKTKRPAKAVDLLVKAKELQPSDVEIRSSLIEAYLASDQKSKIDREKDELADLDKKIIQKDKKNIDSRVRLAEYSYDKSDFKTAYEIYTELAALTPKEKVVFKRLNEIALQNGNKKDAADYLKRFIALDPENAKANRSLGSILYDLGDYDGALEAFRKALTTDPKMTGLYKQYSDIVVKKGLEDEAIKVLNAAIAAGEADNTAYSTLGKIYQKRKAYASAIKMYKKASDADPKNSEILTQLAECQANSGAVNEAVLTYEQVILINPKAKDEFKALGDLQMKLAKNADAIKTYKTYLDKAPEDNTIAKTVGMYEYENKRYEEATKYLEMVKDAKVKNTTYLVALGLSYYNIKKYDKAAELLAKVQAGKVSEDVLKEILKPLAESYENTGKENEASETYLEYTKLKGVSDPDASYKKALLREKTDKKTAIAMYALNTKVFTGDHRNYLRLGMLLAEDNTQLSSAADMLNKASQLKPDDATVLDKLGQVYNSVKNGEMELLTYKKLLKIDPQHVEANRRVGLILLKQKKYTEAIINLEIVSTMSPKDVDIMLSLADGYMKTKRTDKAIELLEKAKKLKKNDPELGALLYKLYKQTGKDKQAEAEIKELIELTKDNNLRVVYAKDLIDQSRYDEANTLAGQIKAADPTNLEGLMLSGKIHQAQNRIDDAIETYKMISYINENYAPALYERGNIYLTKSDLERAKSYFEKAQKADAQYALSYLGLARVAKLQKDNANYTKHLNKAKSLDPENKEIIAETKKP